MGLCSTLASSQTIKRIETLTADEGGAQMTFGEVQIDIYTPNSGSCKIYQLEADGNDFQQGALDVFQGKFCFSSFHPTIPTNIFLAPPYASGSNSLKNNSGTKWLDSLNF